MPAPAPNRIAKLRAKAGLTMEALAVAVGSTPSTINKLEKGRIKLTVDWLNRLAPALNCRPIELMIEAPPRPAHINPDLLRRAIYATDQILSEESRDGREIAYADTVALVYDVLVDIKQVREITDETIETLIATKKRDLAKRGI